MTGTVYETYVAALQHDLADVPAAATRLGVARKPTPWFHGVVDDNVPALGPPAALLDAVQARRDEFETKGVPEAEAHNRAMAETDYAERYAAHLDSDPDAQSALKELEARLSEGEDIVLVCFENTDEKRCHRTQLQARLSPNHDD